jgi:HlyD family secretion protein
MTATADITVKKLENVLLIPSAALRFSPPVRQENSSSGGIVSALLPHPPKTENKQRDGSDNNKQQKRIWTLKEGKLMPVSITIGASNGGLTEVTSGDIRQGTEVVTDTITGTKS